MADFFRFCQANLSELKMKLYTGFGDEGKTALFGGETVKKNHLRVEMYGTLDELNSFIGLILSKNKDKAVATDLTAVQNELFTFGAEMATPSTEKRAGFTEQLSKVHIDALENMIDKYSAQVPPLKKFVLPGGCEAASFAHISRTICRRAERMLISLAEEISIRADLIVYLNRLSDLLFIIARYQNVVNKVEDIAWEGIRS